MNDDENKGKINEKRNTRQNQWKLFLTNIEKLRDFYVVLINVLMGGFGFSHSYFSTKKITRQERESHNYVNETTQKFHLIWKFTDDKEMQTTNYYLFHFAQKKKITSQVDAIKRLPNDDNKSVNWRPERDRNRSPLYCNDWNFNDKSLIVNRFV